MLKSLLIAALSAALPLYMSDETAAAAPAEDPNAGASPADGDPASDTTSSATPATTGHDTGTTDALPADADGSADVEPEPQAPVNENTGKVEIEPDFHTEAKERYAGVLAKLHQFENDSVEDLRVELMAIGTLLHLHSKASTDAVLTGDYKATDLS